MSRPLKRSFSLDGHRTSVSLEAPFWDALREVAATQGLSLASLVQHIDRARGAGNGTGTGPDPGDGIGLSGAIRVYLLDYYRSRASASHPKFASALPRPAM